MPQYQIEWHYPPNYRHDLAARLAESIRRYNAALDLLRCQCADIAGTSLHTWNQETLFAYIDLMKDWYRSQTGKDLT